MCFENLCQIQKEISLPCDEEKISWSIYYNIGMVGFLEGERLKRGI